MTPRRDVASSLHERATTRRRNRPPPFRSPFVNCFIEHDPFWGHFAQEKISQTKPFLQLGRGAREQIERKFRIEPKFDLGGLQIAFAPEGQHHQHVNI